MNSVDRLSPMRRPRTIYRPDGHRWMYCRWVSAHCGSPSWPLNEPRGDCESRRNHMVIAPSCAFPRAPVSIDAEARRVSQMVGGQNRIMQPWLN